MTMIHKIPFSELNIWDVKSFFHQADVFSDKHPIVLFGEFLSKPQIEKIKIEDSGEYKILGARSYGKGVFVNRIVKGSTLKMRTYQQAKENHLFWCKVDTKNGAFGIITEDLADGVGSSNMTFAKIETDKANPEYLQILFKSKKVNEYMDGYVSGTTNRKYIKPDQLREEVKIPLPLLNEQNRIVKNYSFRQNLALKQGLKIADLEKEIQIVLFEKLGISSIENESRVSTLKLIKYSKILDWNSGFNSLAKFESRIFENISIDLRNSIAKDVFRGKSPKYDKNGKSLIINQKCNRWNYIEIEHSKTVNDSWYNKIDIKFFTQEGDILINSTGEGTIGRATYLNKSNAGLLYDSHILLLRLDKEFVNPLFFTYLFNSEYGQSQVENIKSAQTTKQTELGVSNLKKISFPLPPIKTQNELAQTVFDIENQIQELKTESELNKILAIKEFEQEIFKS